MNCGGVNTGDWLCPSFCQEHCCVMFKVRTLWTMKNGVKCWSHKCLDPVIEFSNFILITKKGYSPLMTICSLFKFCRVLLKFLIFLNLVKYLYPPAKMYNQNQMAQKCSFSPFFHSDSTGLSGG